MHILSFLAVLLAILLAFIGFFGLAVKSFRPKAKQFLSLGGGLFILGLIGVAAFDPGDREAQEKGFANAAEEHTAMAAGFKSPAEWKKHLEDQKRADAAAATSAGFADVAAFKLAREKGISNGKDWALEQDRLAREERFDAVRKAVGARLVSVEEKQAPDGPELRLRIKTRGVSPYMDFFGLGGDIADVARKLRQKPANYTTVTVGFDVPTIDKYGQDGGLEKAGTLTWKADEMAKINLDLGPDYLFKNASKVSLGRFGRDLAEAYCTNRVDFSDPRYCRN